MSDIFVFFPFLYFAGLYQLYHFFAMNLAKIPLISALAFCCNLIPATPAIVLNNDPKTRINYNLTISMAK